jgi:hypothetical protein
MMDIENKLSSVGSSTDLEKLTQLCLHFDPHVKPIPEEQIKILNDLKIDHHQIDPYQLTQKLLVMLINNSKH